MLEFLSRQVVKISRNEPFKASSKFGRCHLLTTAVKSLWTKEAIQRNIEQQLTHMRTGKELILATKPYAADFTAKSWWVVLSTAFLLVVAIVGTLWNFHLASATAFSIKIICSIF